MRNKLSITFVLLSLFMIAVSCGNRPSYVLSEKKMVNLMVDMELAEAYENTQGSASSQERIEMGKRVLEAHGVSEETLDTTLAWYGRNIDEYAELFEKVDKELVKRRKKYTEIPGAKPKEIDELWPYSSHLIISPLSGYDAFSFSLPHPEILKGDVIDLSFSLPNPSALKASLGVEYTDGYGEAATTSFTSKSHIQMTLQTDTAKEVARIFGTMHFKDIKVLPLYIDSISIKASPLDSVSYRSKRRIQKSFGPLPIP